MLGMLRGEFGLELLEVVGATRAQRQVTALGGELAGHAGAEARAGAGDEDLLPSHPSRITKLERCHESAPWDVHRSCDSSRRDRHRSSALLCSRSPARRPPLTDERPLYHLVDTAAQRCRPPTPWRPTSGSTADRSRIPPASRRCWTPSRADAREPRHRPGLRADGVPGPDPRHRGHRVHPLRAVEARPRRGTRRSARPVRVTRGHRRLQPRTMVDEIALQWDVAARPGLRGCARATPRSAVIAARALDPLYRRRWTFATQLLLRP